jgi:dTDP-4-amino-4,6-dideoxygalactose transaminase
MQGAAADLACSMLSLPVDQRYGDDDMDYLIQAVTRFFEGVDCG